MCGNPGPIKDRCTGCKKNRPKYTKIRSWGIFEGPLKNALHRLKYRKDIGLGEALAKPLTEYYLSLGWEADMVMPVPLSKARRAERGYNQAALLALPLALGLTLPYKPAALSRVIDTRSQVGLSAKERRDNLSGAFSANRVDVQGHKVLLLDDVITTGSTMNHCAEALIAGGAREVFGLTLARAVLE